MIALRAVQTVDFTTAHWAPLPYDLLDRCSRRIVNEVKGVSRGVVSAEGRKLLFTTNVPNAGAIDEALLRPGRCFATVTVRRLTREEGRGLALRLCGGDAARAERVLAGATNADQRSVSTAEIYQSWGRLTSAPEHLLTTAAFGVKCAPP